MENKEKKHKNKKEEIKEKCNCKEGEACTCTEECTCEECSCTEECNCTDECNCHEECSCTEECNCHDSSDKIKLLEDALLRSQAELINYKRRKDEETTRIIKYAEEDILKGFLPILDNFERAINMDDDNLEDEVSKFLEGFKLIYKQTKDLLLKFEVTEIECLNKPFDPTYHEAIAVEKLPDTESGIVTQVLQKGYMYKDRVLRTAMVKVSE